jgi:hypothetical protein
MPIRVLLGLKNAMRLNTLGRFLLLILPFLVATGYRFDSDRLLGYHHFRQAHTAMTARNFATYEPNILRPTIDGVTYGKELYLNEFPLYPYLLGQLWRVFGERLWIGRLLSVFFTVLALWFFYKLLRRLIEDRWVTDLALLTLGITPVISYFARSLQRQSLFLFALIAGIFYVVRYFDENQWWRLGAGTVALAVAILLNPFAVYIALPLTWYAWKTDGPRLFRRWTLYPAAVVAVLPAVAWYLHVLDAGKSLPTGSIMAITAEYNNRDLFSIERYAMWLDLDNWASLYRNIVRFVVPFVASLAIFVYGAIRAPAEKGYAFFKYWLLAVLLYFLFDFYPIAVVVHQYYYLNVAPLTALFLAYGLIHACHVMARSWVTGFEVLDKRRPEITLKIRYTGRAALLLLILVLATPPFFFYGAYRYSRRMINDDWHAWYYGVPSALSEIVGPSERLSVVADSDDPLFSFVAAPQLNHRLVMYDPDRLERWLETGDFEYLAVVYDQPEFPLEAIVAKIEGAGYLDGPVLRSENFLLFRTDSALNGAEIGLEGLDR